jgi:ATP-dependent helicase/DNAse subunit B
LAKEIWLGPLLGNNRSRLIERCSALVSQNQAHSFLYLAASHPLLELVTQGILDGDRNRGVWGELPVYLFRGFVRHLLATAVDEHGQTLAPRVPIDREELPLKRSLVSQILARLMSTGKLQAIAPLANREGCVNTIATLIGEIERAAKSPAEVAQIIANRIQDAGPQTAGAGAPARQVDFDREVGLIYATYCELLDRHQLSEADADSARALAVLGGELDGKRVEAPSLSKVQLLVLDGFFDFTPVQGEILRLLIPPVADVIVNLNYDHRNPEIFLPFQSTVDHLLGIAAFATPAIPESEREMTVSAHGALAGLRETLFNPTVSDKLQSVADADADHEDAGEPQSEIKYSECGDRDTEIRNVAREVKRLVACEGYTLTDLALVVRQRAAYAETIARVMREESLPCNLESRIDVADIPSARAALKLLAILEQPPTPDAPASPRLAELADLIKSEYFRLGDEDLDALLARFDAEHADLLRDNDQPSKSRPDPQRQKQLQQRHRIGVWDADALENTFAYVGSELRVSEWLKRAQKLVKELPDAAATRELLNIDSGEQARDPDEADQIENAETAKVEEKDVEKKRRPSRDIHPAAIAWAALVVEQFAGRIRAVPREGDPAALRLALMQLLEQFCFRMQIARPIRSAVADSELPQAMLNFNSLEALRRAFFAAIKSIEIAAGIGGGSGAPEPTRLPTFIEEVRRCLNSQSHLLGAADARGLRVLEATDVRGLRFRAVFIAGLVEGGFPLRAARDWIYPHEERERLRQYGLTLEDISPATLLKEEHYFYQAACRATERLYLSRPLLLEDDSETVASYYIDELRRAVAPFKIEATPVRRDYDGRNLEDISRHEELNVALVRQQERHTLASEQGRLLSQPRLTTLLTLSHNDGFLSGSALRRIEIERERAGDFFGPYDGAITDPQLVALLQQRFGPDFRHSASGLSLYGNCAYRFFGQRVLKLEPRGEAALDLQAIDAGKLLHDILRRFFEQHRRQALFKLDREELQQELRELADKVFDEHERVVPPLNKQIWKIDREIRKILLDQVLLYELEIQEKAAAEGVVPAYFEIAFGGMKSNARDPDSTDEPLELTRANFVGDETIRITGQIDRVDVASDKTLVAYDYKLSMGSSKDDIQAGRSLQLPIYLEALERLILPDHEIAGGGYYVIRGGNERRNKGLHRASALRYSGISNRVSSVMSDDEWQKIRNDVIVRIWEFLDQMRAGRFIVDPSEKQKTCRFCDFGAVCRYDRYRIDKKKHASISLRSVPAS